IDQHQHQLAIWAENCPENFRHKHQLVAAEVARVEERPFEDALVLYDAAIEGAHREGFLHEEAIANECAGRFCAARGHTRITNVYLWAPRECFPRWGAAAKVELLDEEFPDLAAGLAPTGAVSRPVSTDETAAAALDLLSLAKAAETLSSEVVLDRLLEKLM